MKLSRCVITGLLLSSWLVNAAMAAPAPGGGTVPLAPVAPVASKLMLGDPNGDGQVTVADATWVLQMVVLAEGGEATIKSLPVVSREQLAAADVTKDDKLDVRDAIQILRIATGLTHITATARFGEMVPIDWGNFKPGSVSFTSMVERPDGKLIVLGAAVAIVDPETGIMEERTSFIHDGGFPRYSPVYVSDRLIAIDDSNNLLFGWSTVPSDPIQVTAFSLSAYGLYQIGDQVWAACGTGSGLAEVNPTTLKFQRMIQAPASINTDYSHAWLQALAYDDVTGLVYGYDTNSVLLGKDATNGLSGKVAIHILDASDPKNAEVDRMVLDLPKTSIQQMAVTRSGNTANLLMLATQQGNQVVLSLDLQTKKTTQVALPEGYFCTYLTPRAEGGYHAIVEKRWRDNYGQINISGYLSTLGVEPSIAQ